MIMMLHEMIRPIPIENLPEVIAAPMGLIIGPTATLNPGEWKEVAKGLFSALGTDGDTIPTSLRDVVDLVKKSNEGSLIHSTLEQLISNAKPPPNLSALATIRWSIVLSTSIDVTFEQVCRRLNNLSPTGRRYSVITDLMQEIPPRTIPIFKLLSSVERNDCVCSSVDYRRHVSKWRKAISDVPDYLKGAPVFCYGLADEPEIMLDLLTEFLASCRPFPRGFLFLANDPLASNEHIIELVGSDRVLLIDANITEFIEASKQHTRSAFTRSLPYFGELPDEPKFMSFYSDLACHVNSRLEPVLAETDRTQLLDLLFSPSVPRWDSYAFDLDFSRSVTDSLVKSITHFPKKISHSNDVVLLSGNTATGKSTLLKRCAFNLANSQHFVLWLKPWFYPDAFRTLTDLFKEIRLHIEKRHHAVIVFLDDLNQLGPTSPRDILNAAEYAKLPIRLVLGVRSSDHALYRNTLNELPISDEIELPDEFTDDELARLPEYLISLNASESLEDAQIQVRTLESRFARDVLSHLYYLLPQTKQSIVSSIADQYFRLGDANAFSKVIIGALEHTPTILKEAYEMVAVAQEYGSPLPVEVLVRALDVEYNEWLDAIDPSGVAKGILYSELLNKSETICYRTRNDIVNHEIVRLVNGGTFGYTGSVAVLSKLLSSCVGRLPAYHEFCKRILLPVSELEHLSYDEGCRLFDAAIGALPEGEKILLHHYGNWHRKRGNQPLKAVATYDLALQSKAPAYSGKSESDAYIHTSYAAAILDSMTTGNVPLDVGQADMIKHLDMARSKEYFDSFVVHVSAGLIMRLADEFNYESKADSLALISRACADLDRALLLLKSEQFGAEPRDRKTIEMLEDARGNILLRLGSVEQLGADAYQVWNEHSRQDGFVLLCRKHYQLAMSTNKGSVFLEAWTKTIELINMIRKSGNIPIPQLSNVALHIYYRWRIRRGLRYQSNEYDPIDWNELAKLAHQSEEVTSGDAFLYYLRALANAHLGEWADAHSMFLRIRKMSIPRESLWKPRDVLLHSSGGSREVQGIVRIRGEQTYLSVEELASDFRTDPNDRWAGDGSVDYAQIRFAFGGPTAVRVSKPNT